MKIIKLIMLISFLSFKTHAQTNAKNLFIDKGKIEYEVTQNFLKTVQGWGDGIIDSKDESAKFLVTYYSLSFANDKSLYKYERASPKNKVPAMFVSSKEDDLWYINLADRQVESTKNIFGELYSLKDSLLNIKWKITNENRIIAGYNCRKAVGKIFDSVYVFAFYTDEILFSGGPMGLTGLPGTILGVTIPRLYTSYIATKVEPNNINPSILDKAPPRKGKKKSFNEMKEFINSRTEDWGKFSHNLIWNAIL